MIIPGCAVLAASFAVAGSALAQSTTTVGPPAVAVVPVLPVGTGTTVPPSTVPAVHETGVVNVVARCPSTENLPAGLNPTSPEFNEFVVAQSRLAATIQQVQSYANTQSATFGALRFGGKGNATVVVSFVGDLQVHAEALTRLVDVPNGVVVCPALQAASARVQLANEILARASGAMVSGTLTPTDGRPVVVLRADRRDVADDLLRTFGSRIQVILGEVAYPDPSVPREDTAGARPCGEVPAAGPTSASLRWSVPRPLRVHSGGDFLTKVSWKNIGRKVIAYESGDPITGLVTRVGSSHVVARYTGAIAGVGHGMALRPGRTDTVYGLVSTASCDIALGYALPPGKYSVRFVFGGFDYSANGGIKVDRFVSNPIPLTITNAAPPPFTPPANPPVTPITLPGAGDGGPGATLAAIPTTTLG